MKKVILFALLFSFDSMSQDALLEAMLKDWSVIKEETDTDYPDNPDNSEPFDNSGPEFYSWELGTPDNIPETIIIYESKPCGW